MEQEQSVYITSLHLKGYKSIRDLSVDLKQGLNIIIGANGSGKTNFMEFLDAAYQPDFGRLLDRRKVECDIKGEPYSVKIKAERAVQNGIKGFHYRVELFKKLGKLENTSSYFLDEEKRLFREEQSNENLDELQMLLYENPCTTSLIQYKNPLNEILKEKLSLGIHKYEGFEDEEGKFPIGSFFEPYLKSSIPLDIFLNRIFVTHGHEISENETIIDFIKEITENNWFPIDELKANLKQFSPIQDIKIDWELARRIIQKEDDGENATIEGFDFQFFVNAEWISWSQLSDGTKRLFYLIGSVTYAENNEIILMEEPELGIHPHQLSLLMNFIKAQSHDKQIIISTHAPEVLNCLKENEIDRIIVARHEGKAGTKMYKLSEKEQKSVQTYMKHQASISDYWLQTGFEKEDKEEVEA